MFDNSITEINYYSNLAKEVLKSKPYDPSAQNVVFYAEQSILALNRRDYLGFRKLRAQVLGYSL